MSNSTVSALVSLLVVFVIARRELRATTVRNGRLWVRPAIVAMLTVMLASTAVIEAPHHVAQLIGWIAGGLALGIGTGFALLQFTTIRDAAAPNAIIAQGSIKTIAVWLVVLVIRYAARLAFGSAGPAQEIDASVGTIAVVAAALIVLATAYHRAIGTRRSAAGVAVALLLFYCLGHPQSASASIAPEFATRYTVDRQTQQNERPFEGMIDVCSNGKAVYTVFSNNFVLTMSVVQRIAPDKTLTLTYLMRSADASPAFANVQVPPSGTPIMRATYSVEYAMTVTILAKDFVRRLRAKVPDSEHPVFPSTLYRTTVGVDKLTCV